MKSRSLTKNKTAAQRTPNKEVQCQTAELLSNGMITTAPQFARVMSALMSDLVNESISPKIANAVSNAGGKLLKVVEMQYRYGKPGGGETNKVLQLVPGEDGSSV